MRRAVLALACAGGAAWAAEAKATERPPIVGVAHIAFQVSDAGKARAFYAALLGYEELSGLRFRINDRQYVEIVPGLPPDQDDRLSHVGFETTDVAALRAYLAAKGFKAADATAAG